jgi:hypothetical protein
MLLSLTTLTFLFAVCRAFFPTNFREKAFGNGGISHESQTHQAYDQLIVEHFASITKDKYTTAMRNALKAIAKANAAVDDDQEHAAKHCDGESFDEARQLLVQAKANITSLVKDNNGPAAQDALGTALHTLQDFYAHSNWVELGNTDIFSAITNADATLVWAGPEEVTCVNCTAPRAGEETWRGCHNCDTNTAGFTSLTSGYYFGEDHPKDGAPIPVGKCHHGK